MTCAEIMERAEKAAGAFGCEKSRATGDMAEFLDACQYIAWNVSMGEYHREGLFRKALRSLGGLGFDVSEADTDMMPDCATVCESALNAVTDTRDLWRVAYRGRAKNPEAYEVVNKADDLMQSIRDGLHFTGTFDENSRALHDAVTNFVDRGARPVTGECEPVMVEYRRDVIVERGRELPERVMFNPPATIAFWGDGTKTVAKCSKEDTFSEYTGLLVCIAKRHLKIPRRGTFEDAMAKLLKRAERPRGGAR